MFIGLVRRVAAGQLGGRERERERPPDDRFSHAFISIKALAGKHPEIYIMYINIA